MVRLLVISTTVFSVPAQTISSWLAAAKSSGYQPRYTEYVRNRPPKNSSSVTRKTHIPSVATSRCCSRSSNWCASAVSGKALLRGVRCRVVVWFPRHDGHLLEILRRRWRRRHPLEADG